MKESAFVNFLDGLSGLTADMVKHLKRLAGKMTGDQRDKASTDLQGLNDKAVSAQETYEAHTKEADQQVTKLEKQMTKFEEEDEQSDALASADAKLTQA